MSITTYRILRVLRGLQPGSRDQDLRARDEGEIVVDYTLFGHPSDGHPDIPDIQVMVSPTFRTSE